MAVASDRSRFHLEQSVSELHHLRRKRIFTNRELSCIVRKRADFEHKINVRGSQASDFTKYAAYEINLDSLRQKRTKRLGITATEFHGQRNIFGILKRATRKFNGDMGLWMQYLSFARRQKSDKKVSEILTQMLRLFPTESTIWIYAAKYAFEAKGDLSEARVYMQRGLRFCTGSKEMWTEYARLELIQITKLAARNQILGLDGVGGIYSKSHLWNSEIVPGDFEDKFTYAAEDSTPLTDEAIGLDGHDPETSQSAAEKLGAIPMAIFDAALEESEDCCGIAWAFFDMVAKFDVAPRGIILNHIMDRMQCLAPHSVETLTRSVKQPMIGVDPGSSDYPRSLTVSLDRYHQTPGKIDTISSRREFYAWMEGWVNELLNTKGLENDIRKVLRAVLKQTQVEIRAIKG